MIKLDRKFENGVKMKKMLLILVVVIGFGVISNAQDIILKKDGLELKTKVLEITEQQIRFKEFDFQNGPTRNLNISEVFMITYENGKKEVFNKPLEKENISISKALIQEEKIEETAKQNHTNLLESLSIQGNKIYASNGVQLSKDEVRNKMQIVPAALAQYDQGRSIRGVGFVFFIPQCILLGAGIGTLIGTLMGGKIQYTTTYILSGASIACGIPAIICFTVGNKQIQNSIGTYNRGINQKNMSALSLNLGITQSGGIGIILKY